MRMPGRDRSGFTLIELLVVVVLMGIVGATLTRVLLNMQRAARAQSERVTLQGNLRAGIAFVPAELRDLAAEDIIVAQPDLIEYRAMRATGFACSATAANIVLRNSILYTYRPITPGRDSLFIFVEDDVTLAADDQWVAAGIAGVGTANCPDGSAGTLLTLAAPSGAYTSAVALMNFDAPVRTFERMEIALYDADGRSWLGARSVSAGETSLQPVLGPLRAGDGFSLSYQANNGAATTTVADIRAINVKFFAESGAPISSGYGGPVIAEDSIVTRVRLRNEY